MASWKDFTRLVTRIPRIGPTGGTRQYDSDTDGNLIVPIEKGTGPLPLEFSVLKRIADLSMLVRLDTPIMRMRRPERTLTFASWCQKLTYMLLRLNSVNIVAIRGDDGRILELRSFFDYTETNVDNHWKKHFQEGERDYEDIDPNDILQFSAVPFPSDREQSRRFVRNAEVTHWRMFRNLDKLYGVAAYEDDPLGGKLPPEKEVAALKKLGTDISEQSIAVLPTKMKFYPAAVREKILDSQEGVLRSWANFYSCPTSLFGVDLPTHSDTTVTATYAAFVRQCLMPLLEPVWQGISDFMGQPITADYSRIEKSSDVELADVLMKQAQSQIFTIDELREKADKPPMPGGKGKEIPQTAGAPMTGEKNDAGTNDRRKK